MNRIPYEYNGINSLLRLLDGLLDDSFFETDLVGGGRANIADIGEDYIIELALPGFDEGDIALVFENGLLTITAERDVESRLEYKGSTRAQSQSMLVKRSFILGDIDESGISKEFKDGVLTVRVRK